MCVRQWRSGEGVPDATTLTITANCGGSNGYRTRLWKTKLQDNPFHPEWCYTITPSGN